MMITSETLRSLSTKELRKLNKLVVETIKNRDASVRSQLSVGDSVSIDHPRYAGKNLTIVKISRTKAVVTEVGTFSMWNVPLSMIEVL